ncbi:Late embryogenesis abundant protein LEA-2 subgroup domain-containing protein [Dioscorea alata]|uniref:Late embryogenesis abundant protein LEA-2 subgroup domain-containing protein n=1 Tax=Dioscorea alata TaxID=55571 RepID=A0ACB7TYJ9_DIOAL|nr:Late embryogenesis abundant protein LEA-2 subgroup domain-containing protein [Dioscorea alata]
MASSSSSSAPHHHPHLDRIRSQVAVHARRFQDTLTSRIARYVCGIVLTVLLVSGIIFFILWLALRPHRPRFHLSSFSLSALNPNSPISFSVLDRNPNHNIGIFYDAIDASIFFMDREVGSIPALSPPFYQPANNTTEFRGAIPGNGASGGEGSPGAGSQAPDRVTGFRVELKSWIRFKVTTFDTQRHKMHVSCDAGVGADGQLLPEFRRRCSIYFF